MPTGRLFGRGDLQEMREAVVDRQLKLRFLIGESLTSRVAVHRSLGLRAAAASEASVPAGERLTSNRKTLSGSRGEALGFT